MWLAILLTLAILFTFGGYMIESTNLVFDWFKWAGDWVRGMILIGMVLFLLCIIIQIWICAITQIWI